MGNPYGAGCTVDNVDLAAIEADVSQGVFPHVAAGAHGVSRTTFWRMMTEGQKYAELKANGQKLTETQEKYLLFHETIDRAHRRARAIAEARVAKEKPDFWLSRGPGRDRGPDDPGWSESIKVERKDTIELTAGGNLAGLLDSIFGARDVTPIEARCEEQTPVLIPDPQEAEKTPQIESIAATDTKEEGG